MERFTGVATVTSWCHTDKGKTIITLKCETQNTASHYISPAYTTIPCYLDQNTKSSIVHVTTF